MGTPITAPTAEILRASYQQEAARLLFPTDPHLSRVFSYKAAESAVKLAKFPAFSSSPLAIVADEALVCRYCGLLLMPGMHNTTVRVRPLRRGSTRRRRSSRNERRHLSMASILVSKLDGGKQIPTNRSNVISKVDDIIKESKYRYNYRRLINTKDGEGRNAIVYTCGLCGSKTHFKGITVRRDEFKKAKINGKNSLEGNQQVESLVKSRKIMSRSSSLSPHSFTKKDAIQSHPHLAPKIIQRANSQEVCQGIGEDEEFVRLPTSIPATSNSFATAKSSANDKLTIPDIEQSLKKKKKKKSLGKPQASKSALMNFLSSLND